MRIDWEPKRSKGNFVRSIIASGRVLDVGCGNNSPQWFRHTRPDLYYIGLDVGDYYQDGNPCDFADEYLIVAPEHFAQKIESFAGSLDAVVSSHNLEHCTEPGRVLEAMVAALRPGGKIYLSFPCEESVSFPSRAGCLNFFDDRTHQFVPSWTRTLETLRNAGCAFDFTAKRYRPFPLFLKGLVLEPLSHARRQVLGEGATWALYGFESVIWASKSPPPASHT